MPMVKGNVKKDIILVVSVTLILALSVIQFIFSSDPNISGLVVSAGGDRPIRSYCTDSDGGIHPTVYGELSLMFKSRTKSFKDVCLSNQELKEYYCNKNRPAYERIVCENGCSQGACVVIVPPLPYSHKYLDYNSYERVLSLLNMENDNVASFVVSLNGTGVIVHKGLTYPFLFPFVNLTDSMFFVDTDRDSWLETNITIGSYFKLK